MEVTLLACVFGALALTVSGAPTYTESEEALLAKQYAEDWNHYLREPRSHFAPQYLTPCAANSLHPPTYGPQYNPGFNRYPGAQFNLGPQYTPGAQFGPGYGGPHYRAVDETPIEPELLAFSDAEQFQQGQALPSDHNPVARYGVGLSSSYVSPVHSGLALRGPVLTSGTGPAYGVFPNANVGGCSIPLLLSCSPSVTSGYTVGSGGHIGNYGGYGTGLVDSYRLAEEQNHHDHFTGGNHEHTAEESMDHQSKVIPSKASAVQQTHA